MFFPGATYFLNVLGWALLNSLWQAAILYGIYRLLITVFSALGAAARHRLALFLLTASIVWFFAGLFWGSGFPAPGQMVLSNNPLYQVWLVSAKTAGKLAPYISMVYITCVVFLFIKLAMLLRRNRLLRGGQKVKMPVGWRLYIKDIAERLGIRREVTALLSHRVDSPQVVGFLKPLILVPVAFLNQLTTVQAEAVLLHELVHIKRNDYLVNLFLATAEILFFFNPFTRQIIASIRREREYSCDDMVMQFRYPPRHYAAALLTLEKHRGQLASFGVAAGGAGGKQLLARIQRLLGADNKRKPTLQSSALFFTALLLMGIVFTRPVAETTGKQNTKPPVIAALTVTNTPKDFGPESLVLKKEAIALKLRDRPESCDRSDITANEARNNRVLLVRPATALPGWMAVQQVQAALQSGERDFSLPEEASPERPASPEYSTTLPYVPGNSFSYYLVPDTTHPVITSLTYEQCMAREALEKTRKALEQIDWKKIEGQLKDKTAAARLRNEITRELARLNWQKINEESRQQLQQEQSARLQKLAQQQQQVQHYREAAVYFEALQKKLQDNQQYLNDLQQQQDLYQKMLEDRNNRTADSLKKKRVVVI